MHNFWQYHLLEVPSVVQKRWYWLRRGNMKECRFTEIYKITLSNRRTVRTKFDRLKAKNIRNKMDFKYFRINYDK